jgi:hypothetical protein
MNWWRRLSWETRLLALAIAGLLVMALLARWLGR